MPWKRLAQTSLSDTRAKHHEALEKLDDIHQLIDWRNQARRGRPGRDVGI